MRRFFSSMMLGLLLFTANASASIHYNEDGSPNYDKINEDMVKVEQVEKMYVNEDDLSIKQDSFYIHTGHNVWIKTNTMHRDKTGMFTLRASICKAMKGGVYAAYEKSWKCPYCYHYWPIGTPCQNKDCPSRYK